jgi:hypothetical protein
VKGHFHDDIPVAPHHAKERGLVRPVLIRRLRTIAAIGAVGLVAALVPVVLGGNALAASAFSTALVNQGNGNCADVPNGASTSALQLIQWTCNSGTNQSFAFAPVAGSSDTYSIATVASGSCVDIFGASSADNAAVIQYACHSGMNQQFRLQPVSVSGATNTFNLVSVASSKCIVPAADASASNTALVQLPCSSATSRVWRLPNFNGGGNPNPTPTVSPTKPTPSTSPSASRSATPSRSVSPSASSGPPPAKTVRVFWLKPTNVAFDQRYPDGISDVMREAQRFYKQSLGKTFTLNSTVVEVINGQHDTNWYITNNCPAGGSHYECVILNGQAELQQRFGLDNRWLNVIEVSAEEVGQSGGGGLPGWVLLSGHDADGAAGKIEAMPRWYGGMVHELGHAFGLPDASSTDGTCMSATFYSYPNCIFNQSQRNSMLNGPFGSFLS